MPGLNASVGSGGGGTSATALMSKPDTACAICCSRSASSMPYIIESGREAAGMPASSGDCIEKTSAQYHKPHHDNRLPKSTQHVERVKRPADCELTGSYHVPSVRIECRFGSRRETIRRWR